MKVSEEELAGAQAYNSLHVPALFQQWAPQVAEAAGISEGDRVLDVACGTGVLTLEAQNRVGKTGSVFGLDAMPGMLAVAAELSPEINWQQGIAESLPYDDESFDAVVSQFGLMFFQDRIAALTEMSRVAKSESKIAVAVWDAIDNCQVYPEAVSLFSKLAGLEAADALKAPFALGDRDELQSIFEQADFDLIDINTKTGKAQFPNIRVMIEAELRGWLPVMGVHLDEQTIQTILREAEFEFAKYVTTNGTMEFDVSAHIVSLKV